MDKYLNFNSSIVWFTMFGKFLFNPHQYTLTSTGIMLGLLGLEFAYHGFRDIREEKRSKMFKKK